MILKNGFLFSMHRLFKMIGPFKGVLNIFCLEVIVSILSPNVSNFFALSGLPNAVSKKPPTSPSSNLSNVPLFHYLKIISSFKPVFKLHSILLNSSITLPLSFIFWNIYFLIIISTTLFLISVLKSF